jgi:hypothetical protein
MGRLSRCYAREIHASKLCSVGGAALAAWLFSCMPAAPAAVDAPIIEVSGKPPQRRPDAVSVEVPGAMPSVAVHSQARGVIALREPLGGDAVRDLVFSLMDAWQNESLDALAGLLTADARPFDGHTLGRDALLDAWRQRLHAHRYNRLGGTDLVRRERIEQWDFDELSAAATPPFPAPPTEMRPGELYVRVPLETTGVAGEKLYGDVIELLVRREDGKYKIVAYREADLQ